MSAITAVKSQPSHRPCPEGAIGVERIWFVLAAEHHEEAVAVVFIHPPVQQRVGKSRAHGHYVEHSVNQFVFL